MLNRKNNVSKGTPENQIIIDAGIKAMKAIAEVSVETLAEI